MSELTTEELTQYIKGQAHRIQSLTEENEKLKMANKANSYQIKINSDNWATLTTENAKLTEALDEVEIYVREITRLQKVLPGEQYSSLIEMETKEALSTIRKAREQNGH